MSLSWRKVARNNKSEVRLKGCRAFSVTNRKASVWRSLSDAIS
nr:MULTISPECIES: hypothetical protein [Kamptonema]